MWIENAVTSRSDVESASWAYQQALSDVIDAERVSLSVVCLSDDDVRRLARDKDLWWRNLVSDAQLLIGRSPEDLAAVSTLPLLRVASASHEQNAPGFWS
jgi:hypothetical protein